MRVVIDTNIFLVFISSKSSFHQIYKCVLNGKIQLCVTTEILLEYEEKIIEKMNLQTAELAMKAILNAKSVIKVNNYYSLALIKNDYDDNKFSDCAFTANVEYLVTNDKDFDVLKKLEFPQIKVIDIFEFEKILLEQKLIE